MKLEIPEGWIKGEKLMIDMYFIGENRLYRVYPERFNYPFFVKTSKIPFKCIAELADLTGKELVDFHKWWDNENKI